MTMGAGELTRLIRIEQLSGAVDTLNQPLDEWVLFKTRWARPLGMTGMAAIRAAGNDSIGAVPTRCSWRIRYLATGLTIGMRVVYDGVIFDIRDIRQDYDGHEYTDLVCETGATNGS